MFFEKALQYANDVIEGKEIANKYVKRQCEWFLRDLGRQDNPDYPFYLDFSELEQVEGIFALLNFATGLGDIKGKSVLEGLVGFQAFLLCNLFGWRFKDQPYKYKHRDVTLFICRKNGKTWLVALIMIVLMIKEDEFSEFYSICKDRELASEVKKAIGQVISSSPAIEKYFTVPKTLSGKVICKLTNSFYQPRTADPTANNGLRPSCFCADEVGAFKDYSNINAMESGQLSVRNPLRIKMTTAYAESLSIMLQELDYIKKVYDGVIEDDRMFALLYYAEEGHEWDDYGMYQANPLRLEENYTEIRDNRKKAIETPSKREEYLCKHMNIFLESNSGENFIDIEDVRKCKITDFDWRNRQVWLGVDLSQTTDNCAVAMCTEEDSKIYADVVAFIPAERVLEKNRNEKINYNEFINAGKCFACGDLVIDYSFIEDFIMQLESKLGVIVMGVGYDRYNCISTAMRLEKDAGLRTVEIRQHSSTLHPATKLLREKVLSQEFFYLDNKLLEINFMNARIVEDANKNIYVHKKKSTGKVDCVIALINSIWMIQQDVIFNPDHDWSIQVI
jgi:phage terminase large subunit-like protein